MKVKLPIVTKNEIVDGKRIFETAERDFEMDMSLACQMRWETKFPELAAKETIVDYAERTKELKSTSPAIILSKIKLLYCFFETDMSFLQFIKMFDFSQLEYTNSLVTRINEILEIVLNSSSEKN